MSRKTLPIVTATLDKIVGGGQTLATMESGQKLFVWGGLPSETVKVQLTKIKSSMAEGVVTEVIAASKDRITPRDSDSFLSTSPWQIMNFGSEQHYKAALIEEAFELHDIVLPNSIEVYSDGKEYEYRNKIEFSWWWDTEADQLDLAFYRRGTHSKIAVTQMSLASPEIMRAALSIRDLLREKRTEGRSLKTLLLRSTTSGQVSVQLYLKDKQALTLNNEEFASLDVQGLDIIFSNPKSPASVITKYLQQLGSTTLTDSILDVPFNYATEGFFQINLPVYEQALTDMKAWIDQEKPTLDLYSGVGSIGLTIGSTPVTLVEVNESAVNEMIRNIKSLKKEATPILATAETALDYIKKDQNIIIDPPRAGLHQDVIDKLLESQPDTIIYLSCNPATQARDCALLAEKYGIAHHKGYNFFPRTPHIEHLVILSKR